MDDVCFVIMLMNIQKSSTANINQGGIMIFISISNNNSEKAVAFKNKKVKFFELPTITERHHYSPISFKDGYRKGENFQGVSTAVLDIDDGNSIVEATQKLKGYKYLIVTTKSHQKSEKNGRPLKPCDRYRLFLALEKPITDPKVYQRVITELIKEFKADEACKDLARFYYCNPDQEIIFGDGKKYWDIASYMMDTPATQSSAVIRRQKKSNVLSKDSMIRCEDGNNMSVKEWHSYLTDRERLMVHCPIAPESHNNNDAKASCSMNKNGDYLNLKCFSCGGASSVRVGKTNDEQGDKKFHYYVPDFDKEAAIRELTRGLNTMSEIITEFIRLLPPLEKEEKKEKKND